MIPFKLTEEYLAEIEQLIDNQQDGQLSALLAEVHYADVAEIINELDEDHATYLIKLLDSEKTSETLTELDVDVREAILANLSAKEIAGELDELDTDDAADIIGELPKNMVQEVISELEDREHAKHIVDLLRYDENSAGGLMAKELVKVNENWNVLTCVKEMRAQAENVTRVHSIYVVDDEGKLKGRLSLKDLLTTSTKTHISEVYIPKVDAVNVNEKPEEVAKIMSKYDLEAIPVVDEIGRLVGRITIDDIVDVIREEAEKDYQLAAGISQDVEADDSIWDLTRARLPWLFLGLLGGVGAAAIMGGFETLMSDYGVLFFFTPLIAAMAGNVGVQSSAIMVQGLANDDLKGSITGRLIKEMLLALLNGTVLASILLFFTWLWKGSFLTSLAISISLITVTVVAGIIGTFIPLFLHKRGIDPAIATGPFITTSNDIFGILIYFSIAKVILGI
ncbi:magnesium transporter [Arenibacter algicola]|jgi:magnesium transporter|uniref:Magnesium transporter MgtE n=1 Tax=Arenibacter algicola TaxID=616991 RepID=A0A221UVQ8_9FLAO|nr:MULTISPECIES: magnesium transporter [Arenibacter]ASO05343.1 magnesium transporter MgtE [Arenibacter algicola]MDX1758572.1 magnesium transporter [Arenibacter algicola]GBF21237.1 magnesium transporter MgtE [Arenibacter sp. NBRC 103722]|tara:strand:+ start:20729 stop:22081 length:1353 start_codon:yes stop_codon:yes gene_type:complete|eukprot:TRINITY_DN6802_c0_g2_i1.p2 TRINITY_DN6802_c0_g2~~TRINITY_DN6802_c0_g2_i1.p2  ORF type:complete len:451 (-),score=112.77 TRINITY_DN6802_c0_g2_i1:1175-2527(-)